MDKEETQNRLNALMERVNANEKTVEKIIVELKHINEGLVDMIGMFTDGFMRTNNKAECIQTGIIDQCPECLYTEGRHKKGCPNEPQRHSQCDRCGAHNYWHEPGCNRKPIFYRCPECLRHIGKEHIEGCSYKLKFQCPDCGLFDEHTERCPNKK